MNNYYVYILINPINNQPFYVGKGKGQRYLEHRYDKSNPNKIQIIQDIKNAGYNYEVQFHIQHITDKQACQEEITLIEKLGRITDGGILTNLSKGGEGGDHLSGHPDIDAIKNRMSISKQSPSEQTRLKTTWLALNSKYQTGDKNPFRKWIKTATPEQIQKWKDKISQSKKGKSAHTTEWKDKLSNMNKGGNNPNSKNCIVTFPNGNKTLILKGQLKSFCVEYHLTYTNMCAIKKTGKTHKKYLCQSYEENLTSVTSHIQRY